MSRVTRPDQYRDVNNAVLPHRAVWDSFRGSSLGGSQLVYYAYARPNTAAMTSASFEAKAVWQIHKITYTSLQGSTTNVIQKIEFCNGSNDYNQVWDYGYTGTVTGITQASPGVVTLSATTWSDGTAVANGQVIEISGVVGMTEVNGQYFAVSGWNSGAKTFNLVSALTGSNVSTTAYTAYTSAGTTYLHTFANATYY